MKSKKIVALMTSAVLFSQLLYVNPTIINAQVTDSSSETADSSQEATDPSLEATDPSLEATDPSLEATDSSSETADSSQKATNSSSEIEDKCHTEETIKKEYPNSVKFQGIGCQTGTPHGFTLKLDTENMKLQATDIKCGWDQIHHYFPNTPYITIKLIGKDGNVKKSFTLNGNEKTEKAEELNNWEFAYGDYLQLYHAEADWRTTISGTVKNATCGTHYDQRVSKDILEHNMFKITRLGLKQVKTYPNVITLAGVGCQEGTHRFEILFNTDTKKLNVRVLNGVGDGKTHPFHPYFGNNEYIKITLLDQDGNIKHEASLTGNENVTKIQNELSKWNFEYGYRIRIKHEEADWRTKISGTVTDPKGNTVNLSEKTSKEDLNKYDFEITESGLKEVPTFTNELNKTKITLAGVGCQEGTHRFEVTLDPLTKKFNVKILNGVGDGKTHPFHPYFEDNEYINIQLIGVDGNKKKEFSLRGTDNVTIAENELSTWKFEYGDYLKIKHEEADWRTKIEGNVTDPEGKPVDLSQKTDKNVLDNYMFKITKKGLQEIKLYQNVITLAGVGCQEGIHRFEILFNTDTKKLNVRVLNGVGDGKTHPFHPYFGNNEYINIQLIDKDGNKKNEFSLKGTDNVTKLQNELSTWNFVYGDCIRIKHEEADWRTKISGTVEGATPDTNYNERISKDILENNMFKITKNGLKQVKIYKNEISLSGAENKQGKTPSFKLKFDTEAMRIRVTDLVSPCSKLNDEYANTDYICLTLIGEDGVHKKRVVLNGNTRAIKALCFSGVRFEYGDKIKIYHAQAGSTSNKFTISGLVDGLKEGCSDNFSKGVPQNVMHRCAFEITEDGLKEVRDVERSIEEPCLQEVQ